MKKITINVPDDCEVQVVRKEAKFKKGDIIVVVKSMLAISTISMLMPHYGGTITDEEWANNFIYKYVIFRSGNEIQCNNTSIGIYHFLAFHTAEQRDTFLKYNERLVKDYLMID